MDLDSYLDSRYDADDLHAPGSSEAPAGCPRPVRAASMDWPPGCLPGGWLPGRAGGAVDRFNATN